MRDCFPSAARFVSEACWLTLTVLGILAGAPTDAKAQVARVSIRVDGLSCLFCAYGVEKQLKALRGASDPVIDVEAGVATVTPSRDTPLDFTALRAAVKKAGFTPREIRAEGKGRIETSDGRATLVGEDGRLLFLLDEDAVRSLLGSNRAGVLEFTGIVEPKKRHTRKRGLDTITLISVSPVPDEGRD